MTLENDPNKWKYLDLRFCQEAKQLQSGIGDNDDILDIAKSLEGDVCAPTCPSDLEGKCKCIKKDDDTSGTNQVMCGREVNGIVFACPEKCCGFGNGCPEPSRPDVTVTYDKIVTTSPPLEDEETNEDEDDDGTITIDHKMLMYGGGFIALIVLVILLISFKA